MKGLAKSSYKHINYILYDFDNKTTISVCWNAFCLAYGISTNMIKAVSKEIKKGIESSDYNINNMNYLAKKL